ncbi:MAG TPA: DsrE family protein [Chryseolinea sp.]|nr:DsrE family protein [Chryseolinea sp.]
MKYISIVLFCLVTTNAVFGQSQPSSNKKMKILVHITQGPENPTRAALAFLVAKSVIDEGHSVVLFLAGDGVNLFRSDVMENLTGLGTGKLKEHYEAIVKGGGRFYLSGMSSKARGITDEVLKDKPAEFAMPTVLVRLSVECDRVFVY